MPYSPEDVFLGHEHVVEGEAGGGRAADADLVHPRLDHLEARHVGRDEKGGHLAVGLFGIGRAGHHGQHAGDGAVGDVAFGPVEHETASVGCWASATVRTLAASEPASGSVSAKAASVSPVQQRGEPAVLLLGRAEEFERPQADRMMGVDEDGRAAAVGADHLHNAAILLLRETASAIAGRDAHAQHADLPESAHHVVGNQRFAVDAGGVDVIASVLADLVDRALAWRLPVPAGATDTGRSTRCGSGRRTGPWQIRPFRDRKRGVLPPAQSACGEVRFR